MELLLDGSSPVHWAAALVLLVSGVLTAWLGIRDGILRQYLRTNSGPMTGGRAVLAGLLYAGFGLAGVAGAVFFVLRAR